MQFLARLTPVTSRVIITALHKRLQQRHHLHTHTPEQPPLTLMMTSSSSIMSKPITAADHIDHANVQKHVLQ